MNKVLRLSTPFLAAFFILAALAYLGRISRPALATERSSLYERTSLGMAKKQEEPNSLIMVTTLQDETNINGDCSLREAIQAANTNTEVDACPAGEVFTDSMTTMPAFASWASQRRSTLFFQRCSFDCRYEIRHCRINSLVG